MIDYTCRNKHQHLNSSNSVSDPLPGNLYKIKSRDGKPEVKSAKRSGLQEKGTFRKRGKNNFFLGIYHVLIYHLDTHKSMGPDGIHPRVLRELVESLSHFQSFTSSPD